MAADKLGRHQKTKKTALGLARPITRARTANAHAARPPLVRQRPANMAPGGAGFLALALAACLLPSPVAGAQKVCGEGMVAARDFAAIKGKGFAGIDWGKTRVSALGLHDRWGRCG